MLPPAESSAPAEPSPGSGQSRAPAREPAAPAAAAGAGQIPDFFLVGHRKCGTSALYMMLKGHPQIFMPDMKEPRFFSPELRSRFREPGKGRRSDTLEGYMELFTGAGPGQRVGEASPSYLLSEGAAARIAEVRPDARIIAILREPASFLRSLHLQWLNSHIEDQKDFARAIALEEDRRQGRHVPRYSHNPEMLLYSDHIDYVRQLRRFHAAFGEEQVLTLIYEDFRADNVATVRRVLRFLDVDAELPVEAVETERLEGVRSQNLHRLARSVSLATRNPRRAGRLSRTVNALVPAAMRGARFRALWKRVVYRPPQAADEQLMRELRRRFKPEVEALSEYLGRDMVAFWHYDDLA
jgi:Sulfotransferase family